MILFKKARDISQFIARSKQQSRSLGFVPTMGALHKGHLSLIEESKKQNELTACSIFINPTQFNDPKDFQKYPVTLETDIALLEKSGTDILFLPFIEEIYPDGIDHLGYYDLGNLDNILEGQFRPGHFQGVCQVMDRLLTIVKPDRFFMGLKDYQQCLVIKRLLQLKDIPSTLVICDTLREPDGLAMSSRNLRLDPTSRAKAPAIFKTLEFLKRELKPGSLADVKRQATEELAKKGFEIDYIEIAEADTLKPVNEWNGRDDVRGLAAVFLNGIRLIDNLSFTDN